MVVSASDAAGNPAQPGTSVWTVDTTAPPAPSILTGPAAVTNQTGVDFVVANPDGSAVLQCRFDSSSPGDWTHLPLAAAPTSSPARPRTPSRCAPSTRPATPAARPARSAGRSTSRRRSRPSSSAGPSSPTNATTAEFDFVLSDPTDTGFDHFLCSLRRRRLRQLRRRHRPARQRRADRGPAHPRCEDGRQCLAAPERERGRELGLDRRRDGAGVGRPGRPAEPDPEHVGQLHVLLDRATSFGCALDGAAAVPCVSPYVVSPVSEGSHTLVVTASDTAGNAAQPGSATWTVDTTAPAAPIVQRRARQPDHEHVGVLHVRFRTGRGVHLRRGRPGSGGVHQPVRPERAVARRAHPRGRRNRRRAEHQPGQPRLDGDGARHAPDHAPDHASDHASGAPCPGSSSAHHGDRFGEHGPHRSQHRQLLRRRHRRLHLLGDPADGRRRGGPGRDRLRVRGRVPRRAAAARCAVPP